MVIRKIKLKINGISKKNNKNNFIREKIKELTKKIKLPKRTITLFTNNKFIQNKKNKELFF